ncbi:hypothetical protein M569_11835 [Genlisea aurea]|uniref:Glycosyltransferase n=1 Tax=Genlisea aurea TaxID=192259 RepID=S8DJC8_9LAMI|nr:hypothetical protein M569_11835 [Genlisea aurea]
MAGKPHALCIPYPAQGHVNPMLKLAKLLHHKGFCITFVNTHFNHRRLIKSHGIQALSALPDFRFASIPDGLPPSEADATQDVPSLCLSIPNTCLEPLCELIREVNSSNSPPVNCLVVDGVMTFALKAAEAFRLPAVALWTSSACGLLTCMLFQRLVDLGITPSKEEDGYLERVMDWVPGVKDGLRLRDFPSFVRTTDPDDIMLNYMLREMEAIKGAKAILLNTFDALEEEVIGALEEMLPPPLYTVGPLNLSLDRLPDSSVKAIGSSLWKEEDECIRWLDDKEPASVLYVNFGSITVATIEQLTEFAWGLADSGSPFLWVIRPDIVFGESAMLPEEFHVATRERSMVSSWIPQERVLRHAAIGGFLTHSGWNSTLESISSGVPVICWPFFADQQTNCRFSCREWGVGVEIDSEVKRGEVEAVVREVMNGEKGKRMKEKAVEWKKKAVAAAATASDVNLDRVINEVM